MILSMNMKNPELSNKLQQVAPELLYYGNKFLEMPSRKVQSSEFGSIELIEISQKMTNLLKKTRTEIKLGAGLASAQIGEERSIIICYFKGEHEPRIIINPEITYSSEKRSKYTETCLSTKVLFGGEMIRPAFIRAKGFNLYGDEVSFDFSDENKVENLFNSRVFQHEYDHTLGILVKSEIPIIDFNQIISYKLEILD